MKEAKPRSLRTLLVVLFTVQAVAAVGLTGYLSYRHGVRAVDDLAGQLIDGTVARVEQRLDSYFGEARQIVEDNVHLQKVGLLHLEDPLALTRYFWDQGHRFTGLGTIAFANAAGEFAGANEPENYVVIASGALTGGAIRRYAPAADGSPSEKVLREVAGYDARRRDWYRTAVEAGGPAWAPISVSVTGARLDLSAVSPCYGPGGDLLGVFLVDLSLHQISEFLRGLEVGRSGQIVVLERDGVVVASSFDEEPYRIVDRERRDVRRLRAAESGSPLLAAAAAHIDLHGGRFPEGRESFTLEIGGKRHFVVEIPYRNQGLELVTLAIIPESDFMTHVDRSRTTTLLLILAALGAAAALGVWTAGWVTGPIRRLSAAAGSLGEGSWGFDAPVGRNDEVGELARSFEAMAARLRGSVESLEREIAERKRAEASLRDALTQAEDEREKTKAIVASIGDGISIQDREYRVLFQNEIHKELIGDHLGELCYRGYEKRDDICEECPVAKTFEDGAIHRAERAVEFPDGIRHFEITTSPLRDSSGRIVAGIEAVRDVTNRIADRHAIEAEKERLAVTLRSIGDAVVVTDTKSRVTLINKAAEACTGWRAEAAAGRALEEVFHAVSSRTRKACRNPVEEVLATGHIVGLAEGTALIRRDGTEILIEDSAAPIRDQESRIIGVVLVFRDVTEKRRIEGELLRAQKLESLGVLAGGIAHDFNNILMAVLGNISLARLLIGGDHKARLKLDDAEKAVQRATDLARQMLTFSMGGAPVKKISAITEILRESVRFTLSGTTVQAVFRFADDVRAVDVDAGQMSQVFNNLALNALQAMPGGGTIEVEAANVTLSPADVPPLPGGRYVRISFADTGQGMSPEVMERIFDPYFTTKEGGSGLGLATLYSIVKRHDGHVTVESVPLRGTTFRVYLPASESEAASAAPAREEQLTAAGKVLVMDDEEMVLKIVDNMLRALGCEVVTVRDGEEAVAAWKDAVEQGAPFDAAIMDLTIPGGMGGREAVGLLRKIDPRARVIVSSGYSNDPVMAKFAEFGFAGVVTKPYTLESLARALRDVMK